MCVCVRVCVCVYSQAIETGGNVRYILDIISQASKKNACRQFEEHGYFSSFI